MPEYETEAAVPPAFDPQDKESYVTVALYREPEDLSDVDYLCEFEQEPLQRYPYIGVPCFGRLQLDGDWRFGAFDKEKCVCAIVAKEGGSAVKVLGYEEHGLAFTVKGSIAEVSRTAPWEEYLIQPEGLERHFFDIELRLTCQITDGERVQDATAVLTSKGLKSAVRGDLYPVALMWGCLGRGTRIRMGDGSEKVVEHIRIGDRVYDPVKKEAVIVENCWKGMEEEMLEITVESGRSLLVTVDHRS